MSWKPQLFKPKWQHKDPGVRREAVSQSQDPELQSALPEICLGDEDPQVRAAAARRVTDLDVLARGLGSEQNADAKAVFRLRVHALTASVSDSRPPLEARQAVVQNSDDRELLELVASQAPEPDLRRQALVKTSRQGFLGDRAVQDPDPEVRQIAAAAITQHSTLRRVIEALRKKDKVLHQQLSARLHQELLDSGDAQASNQAALELCEKLEAFGLKHVEDALPVPEEIASRWAQISSNVSAELQERYRHIADWLEHAAPEAGEQAAVAEQATSTESPGTADIEPQKPASPSSPSPLAAPLLELEQMIEGSAVLPPARKLSAVENRIRAAWSSLPVPGSQDRSLHERANGLLARIKEKIEAARQQQEQVLEQADGLLVSLKQALEDGALHKALEIRHQLNETGKQFKGSGAWKPVSRELQAVHGRIRELRDWQHWSNDKIRKQLIREMEVLPETDLHPDAILDRIKSLQDHWKELEKSEQIPGDSHYHTSPWMWRRFSAAGQKAFKATKPFLEKRDEIRDRRIQTMTDLAQELKTASSAENPDWTNLNRLLQKTRKQMGNLDGLPHKARKKVASQLRKALDKGNAAMQQRYAEIEKIKLKLVRSAAQLTHLADSDEAISQAKRLQSEWKAAGSLWRSRENELWKAFREPLDPLFGELKANMESEKQEIKARLETQKALCSSLKDLLAGEDGALADSAGKVQGLKDSWRDIERPDRRLQREFQELADRYDQRISDYRRKLANAVRENWWVKSKILHQLEAARLKSPLEAAQIDRARKDWPESQAGQDIDQLLDQRFEAFADSQTVDKVSKDTIQKAQLLCIQLEFLAGLSSPDNEKDLRMKYQVDRLSRSLSGESGRLSAPAEARIAEQEWLTLPVLGKRDHSRFEKRIKAALEEIYRSNSE